MGLHRRYHRHGNSSTTTLGGTLGARPSCPSHWTLSESNLQPPHGQHPHHHPAPCMAPNPVSSPASTACIPTTQSLACPPAAEATCPHPAPETHLGQSSSPAPVALHGAAPGGMAADQGVPAAQPPGTLASTVGPSGPTQPKHLYLPHHVTKVRASAHARMDELMHLPVDCRSKP